MTRIEREKQTVRKMIGLYCSHRLKADTISEAYQHLADFACRRLDHCRYGESKTAVTVYVAEKRYTKQFMDSAQYFTVMAFNERKEEILEYMGTKSGRDTDKAKALNLHTAYTANGTPYYVEADMIIECRIMYAAPFDPQYFKDDVPRQMYSNFPAGLHTEYIGEVVSAWKKAISYDVPNE